MADPIKIVLADDHAVVRKGLRLLLDGEDGLEVVAEAGTADDAMRYVRAHRPAVLGAGPQHARRARRRSTRSRRSRPPATARASSCSRCRRTRSSRASALGQRRGAATCSRRPPTTSWSRRCAAPPRATRTSTRGSAPRWRPRRRSRPGPPDDLTEREVEILRLIALGHTNVEIGEQLYLSRAHGRVPPRAHPAEAAPLEPRRARPLRAGPRAARGAATRFASPRAPAPRGPGRGACRRSCAAATTVARPTPPTVSRTTGRSAARAARRPSAAARAGPAGPGPAPAPIPASAAIACAATAACCAATPPCLTSPSVTSPAANRSMKPSTRPDGVDGHEARRPRPARRPARAATRRGAAHAASTRTEPCRSRCSWPPLQRLGVRVRVHRDAAVVQRALDRPARDRAEHRQRAGLRRDHRQLRVAPDACSARPRLQCELVDRQRPARPGRDDERDAVIRAAAQRLDEALERRDVAGPANVPAPRQRRLAGDARGQEQRVVGQRAAVAERDERSSGSTASTWPWRSDAPARCTSGSRSYARVERGPNGSRTESGR